MDNKQPAELTEAETNGSPVIIRRTMKIRVRLSDGTTRLETFHYS